jgi:serine/threonine protein kinase
VGSSNNIIENTKSSSKNNCNPIEELMANIDLEPESKGSFVGTEDYVPPETINSEESTFASDLWSLGIIIFQLLAGKTPFKGCTPFYTFENILSGKFTVPETISP